MSGPTEGNLGNSPAAPTGKQNVVFQAGSAFTDSLTGLPERDISAYVPDMIGDSGSGGTGGGVPAPAAGDGAAGKFLAATGVWTAPSAPAASPPFNNMLAPSSITAPTIASLTWGNQGTAAAASNLGGALRLYDGPGSGSDNLRFLYKSAPATPWTLVIGVVPNLAFGNNNVGLYCRESSSGKLITWGIGPNSPTPGAGAAIAKWSSYTSYSAVYASVGTTHIPPIAWLSLTDDGTNLTWKTAIDGQNFVTIVQKPRGDFFTSHPDQVGIGINPNYNSQVTDALFVHWAGV